MFWCDGKCWFLLLNIACPVAPDLKERSFQYQDDQKRPGEHHTGRWAATANSLVDTRGMVVPLKFTLETSVQRSSRRSAAACRLA